MAIDSIFKQFVLEISARSSMKVTTDIRVGKLPLQVDMLLTRKGKDISDLRERGMGALYTVFCHSLMVHLLIEYKSDRDSFTPKDFDKILAYKYHLLYKYDEYSRQNTIPVILLTDTRDEVIKIAEPKEICRGVYLAKYDVPVYIIVINRLELVKENYGLLVFSSGKTQTTYLEKLVEKIKEPYITSGEESFLSLCYVYKFEELMEVAESKGVEMSKIRRNIRLAVESVARDDPEFLLNILFEQKSSRVISNFIEQNAEKIIEKAMEDSVTVEKIIQQLSPEEKERIRRLLDESE